MYFRIRRQDGSIETASGGTLVDAAGGTQRLSEGDVRIEVLERWQSPQTGATYPVKWRLRVPSAGLDLVVDRRLDAQEMRTSFIYWEGVVGLSGTSRGRPVEGRGYVELTGYARSMQGVF
jgi:predicted secreted hydrolase